VFEIPRVMWHRSSLCSGGDCVEVAVADEPSADYEGRSDTTFLMRSSKDPSGQILRLTPQEWEGLIAYIKKEPSCNIT
jgi:Domain of unknown function (DUF397)